MALVRRKTSPGLVDIATVSNGTRGYLATDAAALGVVVYHADASEVTVSAATAVDLPTALALVNQEKVVYEFHRVDTLAHAMADSTNAEMTATAVDLTTGIALANDLKAKYNAHLTQASVHYVNDAVNSVSAANATDLASLETLVNAIKTAMNAHMATAIGGHSMRVVAA